MGDLRGVGHTHFGRLVANAARCFLNRLTIFHRSLMPTDKQESMPTPNDEVITKENIDDVLNDDAIPTEEEPQVEDEPTDHEGDEDSSNPNDDEGDSSESSEEEDLSAEEIEAIIATGKRVRDYQKEHPGYDPILIHKDYTKKAQELAEAKRSMKHEPPRAEEAPKPKREEPSVDLSQYSAEDIETFTKLAKGLGFVSKDELKNLDHERQAQTYEQVKHAQINAFLDAHPEYKPENDPDDLRWKQLESEFSYFKLPEDPSRFGILLEKAHKEISGSTTDDTEKVKKILAKKREAKKAATSSGDGGGSPSSTKKPSTRQKALARQYLKGFTDDEINEMID